VDYALVISGFCAGILILSSESGEISPDLFNSTLTNRNEVTNNTQN